MSIEVAWKCLGCGCVFLALPIRTACLTSEKTRLPTGTEGDWKPTKILWRGLRSTFSQSPDFRLRNCPWCGCPKTDRPRELWEPWCRVCAAARAEFAWECSTDVCKGCYPLPDGEKKAKVFALRLREATDG